MAETTSRDSLYIISLHCGRSWGGVISVGVILKCFCFIVQQESLCDFYSNFPFYRALWFSFSSGHTPQLSNMAERT